MKNYRKYIVTENYYLRKVVVYLTIISFFITVIYHLIFDNIFPLIIFLGLFTSISIYYFINKDFKIRRILRRIDEIYNFCYADTENALFKYLFYESTIILEIYHIFNSDNSTNLIVKEIIEIFSKRLNKKFYLNDYKILDDRLIIDMTSLEENRIIMDSIQNVVQNNTIKLSEKYKWNIKFASHILLVGSTGTGKTNFQKYIILNFLNLNNKNDLCIIDGKKGFLYFSFYYFYNQNNCAYDTNSSIKLLSDLNNLMNQRLINLNENKEYIEDINYIDKFTEEGSILLVIDEALTLVTTMQNEDKELKTFDRNYNKFISLLSNLINKGRQANIHVLISGQSIPASVLPTDLRDSLGLRIALGRITRSQAIEVFSTYDVPETDKEYSGVIWHDGLGWKDPKVFLQPYLNESKFNFRKALEELASNRKKINAIRGEAEESQLT